MYASEELVVSVSPASTAAGALSKNGGHGNSGSSGDVSSTPSGGSAATCSFSNRSDGDLPPSDNVSTVAPHSLASPQSSMSSHISSELTSSKIRQERMSSYVANRAVQWERVRWGLRIKPYQKFAHSVDDVYLLSCFLELAQVADINGESTKLLLRTLKFLRACDFSSEDICSVLAHASAYFEDTYELCGCTMDASEVGNVLALQIYVAHSYVQDETCKLHIWHKYLFRKYCTLHMLNAAVLRLLEIRKYMLRLEDQSLATRFRALMSSSLSPRQQQSIDSPSCDCWPHATAPPNAHLRKACS
jgi:hypothetical protein